MRGMVVGEGGRSSGVLLYYDDVYINITVDQTGILFHQVISRPTVFFEITNIGLVVFLLSISLPISYTQQSKCIQP